MTTAEANTHSRNPATANPVQNPNRDTGQRAGSRHRSGTDMNSSLNEATALRLIARTVQTDLAAALAALTMQAEAAAAADIARRGDPAGALAHALACLSRTEPTLALDGNSEHRTLRFLQCLRMTHALAQAAEAARSDPLRSVQLTVYAWTHRPLITPPGADSPRARHYVNCYTVDTAFAGARNNGWYHTRYTYTGTIAATRTLAAARQIKSLMQAKENTHHDRSQNRAYPFHQPRSEIRVEPHPGRSAPPDRYPPA